MSKEPFTIDRLAVSNAEHECEIGEPGDATLDELGAQIHAHDPSLPVDLEGQLLVLLRVRSQGVNAIARASELEAHLRAVLAHGWPEGTTGPVCVRAARTALETAAPPSDETKASDELAAKDAEIARLTARANAAEIMCASERDRRCAIEEQRSRDMLAVIEEREAALGEAKVLRATLAGLEARPALLVLAYKAALYANGVAGAEPHAIDLECAAEIIERGKASGGWERAVLEYAERARAGADEGRAQSSALPTPDHVHEPGDTRGRIASLDALLDVRIIRSTRVALDDVERLNELKTVARLVARDAERILLENETLRQISSTNEPAPIGIPDEPPPPPPTKALEGDAAIGASK